MGTERSRARVAHCCTFIEILSDSNIDVYAL